jgi:hypothetical protein
MDSFTPAALLGLCLGFLWGTGCSLAILYSIFLGGYRKGIEDSFKEQKPKRYLEALKKIEAKQRQTAQSTEQK